MSFSRLARLGVDYKTHKRSTKCIQPNNYFKTDQKLNGEIFSSSKNVFHKENSRNSIRDSNNIEFKERMKTVIEDSEESFLELTFDAANESSNKNTIAQYSAQMIKNPNSEGRKLLHAKTIFFI